MTFAELHAGPAPLLLPNAWDVPSALAFADAGFPAIGTTSFGVASSHGSPDGHRSTRDANLELAGSLASLGVFVSVDIEDGYADDPTEVAAYVDRLVAAGINIEDSTDERLIPPAAHAAKVAAIKASRPDLFVNARVDTYWLGQEASVPATLERAHAYVAAGADGIFVPGATDPDVLTAITSALAVPVNVLVVPGVSLDRLGELGIRRVSTGSLPYRAAMAAAIDAALAVAHGRPIPAATPYDQLQERLVSYEQNRRTRDLGEPSA